MLGMLKIVLGDDPVASGGRIFCQGKVFFADLVRGSADTYIRAVAVKDLHSVVSAAIIPAAATIITVIVIVAPMTVASACSPVSHSFIRCLC